MARATLMEIGDWRDKLEAACAHDPLFAAEHIADAIAVLRHSLTIERRGDVARALEHLEAIEGPRVR